MLGEGLKREEFGYLSGWNEDVPRTGRMMLVPMKIKPFPAEMAMKMQVHFTIISDHTATVFSGI